MKVLFATGAPRTGTTLVDKMLSMHPRIEVLSQPLPLLYVEMKARFLRDHHPGKADEPYPLNDMFRSNHYAIDDFTAYLQTTLIDERFSARILRAMVGYNGQYTKPADWMSFQRDYHAGTLVDYLTGYCRRFGAGPETEVIGAKESFCEEFIPYFIDRGACVVQMIRDPRDSIASLLYKGGAPHAGMSRPLLFYVRQWRKSALFALAHRHRAGYWLLRYEDLTAEPAATLNAMVTSLELEPFDASRFDATLTTADGEPWPSNSSYDATTALSRASVGSHRSVMPPQVCRFIEACCYDDMIALGYTPGIPAQSRRAVLSSHHDDTPLTRAHLACYQWSQAREREELERIDAIERGEFVDDLFIFPLAFRALESAREAGQ
ncbi:MAG: sulfotransferase [Pseudomonadales bacterium]